MHSTDPRNCKSPQQYLASLIIGIKTIKRQRNTMKQHLPSSKNSTFLVAKGITLQAEIKQKQTGPSCFCIN